MAKSWLENVLQEKFSEVLHLGNEINKIFYKKFSGLACEEGEDLIKDLITYAKRFNGFYKKGLAVILESDIQNSQLSLGFKDGFMKLVLPIRIDIRSLIPTNNGNVRGTIEGLIYDSVEQSVFESYRRLWGEGYPGNGDDVSNRLESVNDKQEESFILLREKGWNSILEKLNEKRGEHVSYKDLAQLTGLSSCMIGMNITKHLKKLMGDGYKPCWKKELWNDQFLDPIRKTYDDYFKREFGLVCEVSWRRNLIKRGISSEIQEKLLKDHHSQITEGSVYSMKKTEEVLEKYYKEKSHVVE